MVHVQYVSDFTCPFCYAERTALLRAAEGRDVEIEWLPYEVSPLSKPQVDTYHDPVRKAQYRRKLAPVCRRLELDMKLPPKVVPRPYTNLATQGFYYADLHGKGSEYSARVLEAYYSEEKNIGKLPVLTELAEEVGLNGSEFTEALSNGTHAEAIRDLEDYVISTIQPKTIPTVLIGDSIRLNGGVHTVEQFCEFLDQAEQAQQDTVALFGEGCGEDGCAF